MGRVPCSRPDLKQGAANLMDPPFLGTATASSPKEDEEIRAVFDFFPAVISEVAFTLL